MGRVRVYRRVGSLITLGLIFSNTVVASALTTVTGYVSINNSTETDYKTSDEFMSNVAGKINVSSDYKEILNYDKNKRATDDKVLSYLIENNLVGSDLNLSYDGIKVNTTVLDRFNFRNNDSTINRSDFLATLGKTMFGVKESRPLIFKTKSTRWFNNREQVLTLTDYVPSGYSGDDKEFDFRKGDYSVFVSPNVYEMYFKDLVSSGIVSLKEFSDTKFINSFETFGSIVDGKKSLPMWVDSLGIYDPLSTNIGEYSIVSGSSVLGSGFDISINGFNVSINMNNHSWMFDEDLLVMDALTYIEKALRSKEKEMTVSEANIISYKYGVEYINKVPEENRNTVKFLVAKGIINFENEEEFSYLFQPLKSGFFKTLIYRLHNKDARFDFSSIQLTDSDNYWLSKGFNQTKIDFYIGDAPQFQTTVTEVQEVTKEDKPSLSNLFGLIKSREKLIAEDDRVDKYGNRDYEVRRVFNMTSNTYSYKGIELNKSSKVDGDITKVEYSDTNKTLEVVFKIKAASSVAAVAIIDANTLTKNTSGVITVGRVPAIAYSSASGSNAEDVFIPQSALKELTGLPILVSNDKYLINKQTGARALFLNDNKKALVGNHVFKLTDTVIYGLNGEVYYNLKIIKYLLTESMLSSLHPGQMFFTNGYGGNEKVVSVKNGNNQVDNAYVREFATRSIQSTNSEVKYLKDDFYNISQANSLGNYLIYDLKNDLGYTERSLPMVVEFKYVLPSSAELGIDPNNVIGKFKNNLLTLNEVYNSFYTRPANEVLAKWWDSNIIFNNALLNYIMGTEKIQYVNSGYIVPNITILGDLTETDSSGAIYSTKLNNLFENNLGLGATFVADTKSNTKNTLDFIRSYFNYQSNFLIDTGSTILDGLIHQRKFSFTKGEVGKYAYGQGTQTEDSNFHDFIDYVETSTNGNIYKRLSNCEYLLSYNKDNNSIALKTSSDSIPGEEDLVVGRIYNTALTRAEADANKLMAVREKNGFVQMACLSPQTFYCNGIELFPKEDYTGKLEETIKKLGQDLFGGSEWDMPDWEDIGVRPAGVSLKKGFYYFNGEYWQVEEDGKDPKKVKAKDAKDQKVMIYVSFMLHKTMYKADSLNGNLKKVNNDPKLNGRNITNVGLVSNIIDSIVYGNSDYLTFKQIPNKSKVIIGKNVYEKNGNFLESDIVSVANSSNLVGTEFNGVELPSNLKTLAGEHIGNVPIINKGYGGVNGTVIDYVKSFKLGVGQENSSYSKTLKRTDKGTIVIKDPIFSDNYKPGSPFAGFCYAFNLTDGLKFKEVGDSKRYYLVPISTDKTDGVISDISYFEESLDFTEAEDLVSGLAPTEFKVSNRLSEIVNSLLEAYDIQRIEDFKGLVSYLIRVLCSWLLAVNLVLTLLRNDVIDSMVYDIKYGTNKRGGGYSVAPRFNIDIYSILTFGLQTVDVKVSRVKGIIVTGVLFIIAAFLSINYFK